MAIDDCLRSRGCNIVSICDLCGETYDSINYLFFRCKFSISLWSWLGSIMNCNMDLTSFSSIFSILEKNWSSQAKDVLKQPLLMWYGLFGYVEIKTGLTT